MKEYALFAVLCVLILLGCNKPQFIAGNQEFVDATTEESDSILINTPLVEEMTSTTLNLQDEEKELLAKREESI